MLGTATTEGVLAWARISVPAGFAGEAARGEKRRRRLRGLPRARAMVAKAILGSRFFLGILAWRQTRQAPRLRNVSAKEGGMRERAARADRIGRFSLTRWPNRVDRGLYGAVSRMDSGHGPDDAAVGPGAACLRVSDSRRPPGHPLLCELRFCHLSPHYRPIWRRSRPMRPPAAMPMAATSATFSSSDLAKATSAARSRVALASWAGDSSSVAQAVLRRNP